MQKTNKKKVTEFYKQLKSYENSKQEILSGYLEPLPKFKPNKFNDELYDYKNIDNKRMKNHKPRKHSKRDIEIFKILTKDIETGSFKYVSTDSKIKLYKKYTGKKSNFFKYNVLRLDKPSNTIPAHLYKDGLRHIHPDSKQARSITPREAAVIQSFPNDFEFLSSQTDQYKMIGNAVPPKFSRLIAKTLLKIHS